MSRYYLVVFCLFFFFKQKTAYELRISDWSSDVCSSDLMFGVMVVEPRGGFPTKVDREYVIIQSEFYTKLDPDGRKIDGQSLYEIGSASCRERVCQYV